MQTRPRQHSKQVTSEPSLTLTYAEVAFPQIEIERIFASLGTDRKDRSCFLFVREDEGTKISYLGLDPFEILRVKGGKLEIQNDTETRVVAGDFIEALKLHLQRYATNRIPDLPSFQGGAFGYLGYDIVRHFEPRLKGKGYFQRLEADSEHLDAELMLFDRLFIFDHQARKAFILGRTQVIVNELQELLQAAVLDCARGRVTPLASAELDLSKVSLALGEGKFTAGVTRLKEEIKSGEIFQAVLSDRFTVNQQIDPHALFQTLVDQNQAPYRFHIQTPSVHRLGASPEMLLKVDDRELETHPIAGTRPRGLTPELDQKRAAQLRKSTKERAEHLMLVDLARNDLGRVSEAGSVEVTTYRNLRRFTSVMHLVSKVKGQLQRGQTAVDALVACFPAGTLSGAPKIRAMEILSEIETEPRGFYGGAVVALSFAGDLDSCIAIRSIEVKKNQAVFQAGAGIVADSKAKNEYEEIRSKTQAVRRALGAVLAGSGK